MASIDEIGAHLLSCRLSSGLSQRELANRLGTSQSAIATLERGTTNPTLSTVARYAEASGFALRLVLEPLPLTDAVVERYKKDVDRTLLRENLKASVEERIRSLGEWQQDMRALQEATRHTKRNK